MDPKFAELANYGVLMGSRRRARRWPVAERQNGNAKHKATCHIKVKFNINTQYSTALIKITAFHRPFVQWL